MSKNLYIMCGVPGSGKSWVAKNKLMKDNTWTYISRDEVRYSFLQDEDDYFVHENDVYKEFIQQIQYAIYNSDYQNIIADATHLNWASRRKLLAQFPRKDFTDRIINVIPVVVTCPINVALSRNAAREGRECVPSSVIRRMSIQMDTPNTDPFEYYKIIEVKNDG